MSGNGSYYPINSKVPKTLHSKLKSKAETQGITMNEQIRKDLMTVYSNDVLKPVPMTDFEKWSWRLGKWGGIFSFTSIILYAVFTYV